jgi:hypothetical protein
MSFDPCNCPLNIRESIGISSHKVGAHLGVCEFIPSHSPTIPRAWSVTFGLHSWPARLQAFILVLSPRLRLRHNLLVPCFVWSPIPQIEMIKHLEHLYSSPSSLLFKHTYLLIVPPKSHLTILLFKPFWLASLLLKNIHLLIVPPNPHLATLLFMSKSRPFQLH